MRAERSDALPLVVPTELSAAAIKAFNHRLDDVLNLSPARVDLDCEQIAHITSRHVGLIWKAYRRCVSAGTTLSLVDPPPNLVRTLRVLDLADFFDLEGHTEPPDSVADLADLDQASGAYADQFAPTQADIDAALERFRAYLRRMRVSSATDYELQTIFYEVVTNVRQHGDVGPGAVIQFNSSTTADNIEMVFRDPGRPFDPTARSGHVDFVAAARAGQERGFGLAMIRKMTNHMFYERKTDGTNVLTLHKSRSA